MILLPSFVASENEQAFSSVNFFCVLRFVRETALQNGKYILTKSFQVEGEGMLTNSNNCTAFFLNVLLNGNTFELRVKPSVILAF